MRVRAIGAAVATMLAVCAAGCVLFPATVSRDVRAAWDPLGRSILIVQSVYQTSAPRNPYHADPRARDFVVRLYVHDAEHGLVGASGVGEIDPITGFAGRRLVDEFAEEVWVDDSKRSYELSSGGTSQYEPVYWFPEHDRVVYSLKNIDATFPLDSENDNHTHLVWNQTSDGFLLFYLADRDGLRPVRKVIRVSFDPSSFGFSATELDAAAMVPRRPLATSSGPVDAAGRALILELSGNDTLLKLRPFEDSTPIGPLPWRPFYEPEMIDLGAWTTPQGDNDVSEASFYGFW